MMSLNMIWVVSRIKALGLFGECHAALECQQWKCFQSVCYSTLACLQFAHLLPLNSAAFQASVVLQLLNIKFGAYVRGCH